MFIGCISVVVGGLVARLCIFVWRWISESRSWRGALCCTIDLVQRMVCGREHGPVWSSSRCIMISRAYSVWLDVGGQVCFGLTAAVEPCGVLRVQTLLFPLKETKGGRACFNLFLFSLVQSQRTVRSYGGDAAYGVKIGVISGRRLDAGTGGAGRDWARRWPLKPHTFVLYGGRDIQLSQAQHTKRRTPGLRACSLGEGFCSGLFFGLLHRQPFRGSEH